MTRASAGRLTMRAEDLREPVLERVVAALAAPGAVLADRAVALLLAVGAALVVLACVVATQRTRVSPPIPATGLRGVRGA